MPRSFVGATIAVAISLGATIAVAISLGVAWPAQGQPTAPPPASDGSASTASEALVRRAMKAMEIERQIDAMMTAMLPQMTTRLSRQQGLSDAERTVVVETTLETMREVVTPQIVEAAIPIYAATFTQAELQAMVDFYESPTGRSIMAKTPTIAPKMSQVTQKLIPGAIEEMMVRLCQKLDCTPEGARPRAS